MRPLSFRGPTFLYWIVVLVGSFLADPSRQFEILYSAALFPSPTIPADTARRWRQNFMTNTREIIRITSGKGIIFSSGPGGSADGLRGPLDVVNL